MTDDFQIFSHSVDGDSSVDADIALITAYLARELSLVQIVAVEERLSYDAAFRERVGPVLRGWLVPGSVDPAVVSSARVLTPLAGVSSSITNAEVDAGWERFAAGARPLLGVDDGPQQEAARRNSSSTLQKRRAFTQNAPRASSAGSIMRVAAAAVLIVVPVFAAAQLAIFAANHSDAPGHAVARAIVPSWMRASSTAPVQKPLVDPISDELPLGDGPVQYSMTPVNPDDQQLPAPVELSPPTAKTAQTFGAVLGVAALSDGRLLVNDARNRQIHLFDASLKTSTLALDSVSGSAKSYGLGIYAAIQYRGDSLFLLRGGGAGVMGAANGRGGGPQTGLLLDGRGEIVHAVDLSMSHDPGLGLSQFFADPNGRLLYARAPGVVVGPTTLVCLGPRAIAVPAGGAPAGAAASTTTGGATGGGAGSGGSRGVAGVGDGGCRGGGFSARIGESPDSLPILRIDLEGRRVDTVGFITRPPNQAAGANGGGKLVLVPRAKPATDSVKQVINPLQPVDDWAVLSDGTIALVRGRDYHIDWIHPDGSKSSSAKLPFEWKQLSDTDKQRLVDSTRRAVDALDSVAVVAAAAVVNVRAGTTGRGRAIFDPWSATAPARRSFAYEIVPLSQIADYWPPISPGAAKADADGNLWILPRTSTQSRNGELIYDLINPTRGFVKRVRLPVGRSIAGFGKGGVLYLQAGSLASGFTIERAMVR